MKKIFLGILLGLFCMTSYHVIGAVVYFHNLSIVREQARQKIIFYQRGNKYIATIMIEKDDWLYYLNWFPEIYLSKNSAEFLGSRSSICVFIDSESNIKKRRLGSLKQFTVGPLKKGRNVVELYFEPDLHDTPEILEGDLRFRETSNTAVPVVYLGKAVICLLLFLMSLFFFYQKYIRVKIMSCE